MWQKGKMWVLDRNQTHDLPNAGLVLYLLRYENSWRARTFYWVHMWHVTGFLGTPGSVWRVLGLGLGLGMAGRARGRLVGCSCYLGFGSAASVPRFLGTQPPYATQALRIKCNRFRSFKTVQICRHFGSSFAPVFPWFGMSCDVA